MEVQVSMISLLQGLAVSLERALAIPRPELKQLDTHWRQFLYHAQESLDLLVEITEGRPRDVISCMTLDGSDGKLHLLIDPNGWCVLKLEKKKVEKEIYLGAEDVERVAKQLLEGFHASSPNVMAAWKTRVQPVIGLQEAGWDIFISVDDPRVLFFMHPSDEQRVEQLRLTSSQVYQWLEALGMIPRIWRDRPRMTSNYAQRAKSIIEAKPETLEFWREEIEEADLPTRKKFGWSIYEAAHSLNQLLEGAREIFAPLIPEDNNWVRDAIVAGMSGFIP